MKKKPSTDAILNALGKYLKGYGWRIGVLGPLTIKKAGDRKFTYDVVVEMVGDPPKDDQAKGA